MSAYLDSEGFLDEEEDRERDLLYYSLCPQCQSPQFDGENVMCDDCKENIWGY